MVRGGIGAIRLGDKQMGSERIYFLGASSNGIAHEGIPVALPGSEYRRLIHPIKDFGGCRARLVGTLRTITSSPRPMPLRSAPPSIRRASCRLLLSCAGGFRGSLTTRRRGHAPEASPAGSRYHPNCAR